MFIRLSNDLVYPHYCYSNIKTSIILFIILSSPSHRGTFYYSFSLLVLRLDLLSSRHAIRDCLAWFGNAKASHCVVNWRQFSCFINVEMILRRLKWDVNDFTSRTSKKKHEKLGSVVFGYFFL